ncbi:Zinc finger and SCAN domain-containing protein 29 [Chelonia mydas]|uniref:Zinc finger and SCAN domain-containing protein 29 n=1 Tax=Chelonia mydas TaxID=8469 RepID=M7BFC8_CHEMY|nr:Zinc finger and SCAN domain-containing protein 29 [Chelonia mydas]
MSHNAHPDRFSQQFKLCCPAPKHTGFCSISFKGPVIFEIPLLVCSAWTAHIASSQLTMVAPCGKQSPAWSTPEFLALLALWGEDVVQSQLRSSRRNFDTYSQISCGMLEKGYKWDTHQCNVKIKELKQPYQKARESNHCSGAAPKTCYFYKELDAILSSDLTA